MLRHQLKTRWSSSLRGPTSLLLLGGAHYFCCFRLRMIAVPYRGWAQEILLFLSCFRSLHFLYCSLCRHLEDPQKYLIIQSNYFIFLCCFHWFWLNLSLLHQLYFHWDYSLQFLILFFHLKQVWPLIAFKEGCLA